LFVPQSSYSECLIKSAKQFYLVQEADLLQVLTMLHSWENEDVYLNGKKLTGKALAVLIM